MKSCMNLHKDIVLCLIAWGGISANGHPFYEDDNRPKLPTYNITVFYTHQNITE